MAFSRVYVTAPPGRLGILVCDSTDNQVRTVITKVNEDSPLAGNVFVGDQIICMNKIDVHHMDVAGEIIIGT